MFPIWYSRCVALLGFAIAVALLWVAGISDLWTIMLFIPFGFVVMSVLVRTVIFVVPPPLRVGATFTTLDLTAKPRTIYHK